VWPVSRPEEDGVEINMVLYLPRDAASVPVTRQVLDGCLKTLGVTPDTRADIALALSEACANVIQHAGPGDEYEVQASARNGQCAIEVVNTSSRNGKPAPDGSGTSAGEGGAIVVNGDPVPATAEHGRGLQIIDAVVDNLQLTGSKNEGTIVHFEKALKWLPGAAGQHLFSADGGSKTQLGLPVCQQVLGPRGVAVAQFRGGQVAAPQIAIVRHPVLDIVMRPGRGPQVPQHRVGHGLLACGQVGVQELVGDVLAV
jgi:serine/threonine-protein kinase RsbW